MKKSIIGLVITGLVSIAVAIVFGVITIFTFCGATGTALANGGLEKAMEWIDSQFEQVSEKMNLDDVNLDGLKDLEELTK